MITINRSISPPATPTVAHSAGGCVGMDGVGVDEE